MEYLLEVKNVSKAYSNHQALSDVSLAIPKGTIFGLLGPNGAGKSTLIRIITQIISRDSGEVLLAGQPLQPSHVERIGYLPEERGLYKKMKVGEQLLYLAQLKGMSHKQAITKLKYWFEKLDITSWWHKNVEDLSKGMQQKTQFIATVIHEPELLILDEPFSGFDPVNAQIITQEILELKQRGTTIIFSTHRMETVEELCDHVALINQSRKVLDGEKDAIKDQYRSHVFEVVYKGNLSLLPTDFAILQNDTPAPDSTQSLIKLQKHHSPNDLLRALLEQVEILSFREKLPTMNDIFIAAVTGKQTWQVNTEHTELSSR